MGLVKTIWKKISNTKALEQSSGRMETLFFESVYRIAYVTGLSNTDRGMMYLIYSIAAKLMVSILVVGQLWCFFTEALSFDEIASMINSLGLQSITAYRYINMLINKDLYNKLATSSASPYFDISTERRKKLVKFWSRTNERYLKLVLILGNIAIIIWYIFPLVDDVEYNLLIAVKLPFYYKTPVLYPVAYTIVVILSEYTTYFIMLTDLIIQTHLLHLVCQHTVLCDCFENLLTECKVGFEDVAESDLVNNKHFADKYTKRLGDLVQQHQQMLSHTMDLRNALSGPMLGQLIASGTVICFVGYQATTTIDENVVKSVMSFVFLGYNIFVLYAVCRWCEEVTIQGLKLGEAIYCSGWECGLTKLPGVRASIMLVITRANEPMYLTAGGMYNLSLTSYTTTIDENVVKSVMSFVFLGYNIFVLYAVCRWCEEVTIQGLKLGEAIYCSGWECGLTKLPGVRASIMLVITRANEPMYLTAGGMYNLSLTSYTTLVKTSYSALTMLLKFRHGN